MNYTGIVFTAIALLLLTSAWSVYWWTRKKRIRSLESLAIKYKLESMDGELFDFPATLLDEQLRLRNPYNAFGGHSGDDFLMVFDAEIPTFRKSRPKRTVVARRYGGAVPPRNRVPRDMILFEEGKWRVMTLRPSSFTSGIMFPKEIERAWALLA